MTNNDVLKLALEALKDIHPGNMTPMAEEYWGKAITALRQALEQPEPPAPAAIHQVSMRTGSTNTAWIDCDEGTYNSAALLSTEYNVRKLYTAPPKRKWQGLTQEDIPDEYDPVFDSDEFIAGMAWAQAKLKEKNRG